MLLRQPCDRRRNKSRASRWLLTPAMALVKNFSNNAGTDDIPCHNRHFMSDAKTWQQNWRVLEHCWREAESAFRAAAIVTCGLGGPSSGCAASPTRSASMPASPGNATSPSSCTNEKDERNGQSAIPFHHPRFWPKTTNTIKSWNLWEDASCGASSQDHHLELCLRDHAPALRVVATMGPHSFLVLFGPDVGPIRRCALSCQILAQDLEHKETA